MVENIKKYGLLYGAFIIYSFVAICSKYASAQNTVIKMLLFLGLEIVFLGIYAIVWQQVLRHFTLITAMSSKGIVVILNMIWSIVLFGESIGVYNVIGALVIIFGIWMVSSDE